MNETPKSQMFHEILKMLPDLSQDPAPVLEPEEPNESIEPDPAPAQPEVPQPVISPVRPVNSPIASSRPVRKRKHP